MNSNYYNDIFDFSDNKTSLKNEENTKEDEISINEILTALKNKDIEFYKKISDDENIRDKYLSSCIYPLLRWSSCVGINKIDWNEAKRQGRKKGDKKGPWPSKIYDTENTFFNLIVANEINENFWILTKKDNSGRSHVYLLYLMFLYFLPDLKKEEEFIWLPKPKSKKIKEKIDELLLKIYPDANDIELDILRKKYNGPEKIKELIQFLGLNNVNEKDFISK